MCAEWRLPVFFAGVFALIFFTFFNQIPVAELLLRSTLLTDPTPIEEPYSPE